jgi:hypothetical protein
MKDPNAPARPMSGYFRFINSIRDIVAQETGKRGVKATGILGARWNALSEAEKKTYNDASAKETAVWKVKMDAYKQTPEFTEHQKAKKAKKIKKLTRKAKDKNAPKRPMSAYFRWLKENRAAVIEQVGKDPRKIGKRAGEMWKTVSAEEKARLTQEFLKEREQYQIVLQEYKSSDAYKAFKIEQDKVRAKVAEMKHGKPQKKKKNKKSKKKSAGKQINKVEN